jgi:hypothetical protein
MRRLRNQVLALEDDQIAAAARRRISDRIAELEQEITAHQASLGKLRAELDATPPDAPSIPAGAASCGNAQSPGAAAASAAVSTAFRVPDRRQCP